MVNTVSHIPEIRYDTYNTNFAPTSRCFSNFSKISRPVHGFREIAASNLGYVIINSRELVCLQTYRCLSEDVAFLCASSKSSQSGYFLDSALTETSTERPFEPAPK